MAHTLHNFFDDRDIYRIGGDEFVVFVRDTKEEITGLPIDHSFLTYKKELLECGYTVTKISMKE